MIRPRQRASGDPCMSVPGQKLRSVLQRNEREILQDWVQSQLSATTLRGDLIRENELREQSREFLSLLQTAAQSGSLERTDGTEWAPVRDFLAAVSRARAQQGFTPSETALFVFSLKQPLYSRLRAEVGSDTAALADELWITTQLIDRLGLLTTEMYQKGREEVISRQQQELMELSTP